MHHSCREAQVKTASKLRQLLLITDLSIRGVLKSVEDLLQRYDITSLFIDRFPHHTVRLHTYNHTLSVLEARVLVLAMQITTADCTYALAKLLYNLIFFGYVFVEDFLLPAHFGNFDDRLSELSVSPM